MPDITAIFAGPKTIHAAGYGAVTSSSASVVSELRRDALARRPARHSVRHRYVQTQTYDGKGLLVESLIPPIVNVRT